MVWNGTEAVPRSWKPQAANTSRKGVRAIFHRPLPDRRGLRKIALTPFP
jgi:hypothetical protein